MSRKPTSVNEGTVDLLRHLVKTKSNLNCNSFSEIQVLYEGISKTTNEHLSVQTLSRFFGVIRSEFNPSHHTLDTLSQYLNYSSFRHFELLNQSAMPKNDGSFFISELFNSIFAELPSYPDRNFQLVARNVLKWMIKNPQHYSDIYPTFSKTPVGRKLFFEEFVNIDALNHGYGNGLHYYLLHSMSREESLFAYAMCCYWYFLNRDEQKFREHYACLHTYKHSEIITFHPKVIDRYYAAIIYNQAISTNSEPYSHHTGLTDFDLLTSGNIASLSCSFHVAEALLITGEFHRAWEILNNNICDSIPESLKNEFDTQVRLLKLVSGFLSGNLSKRRSHSLYLELANKPMPFLCENYAALFLQFMKYKLSDRFNVRKQVVESSKKLIEKTGFNYFQLFFKNTVTA